MSSIRGIIRLSALAALLATAGSGCRAADEQESAGGSIHRAALGNAFELNVGESAIIDTTRYRVRFEEIRDDSRCPEGVECAWAGEAEIILSVLTPAQDTVLLAANAGTSAAAQPIGDGYFLRVLQLRPPARAQEEIPMDEYVVRMVVSATAGETGQP